MIVQAPNMRNPCLQLIMSGNLTRSLNEGANVLCFGVNIAP